MAQCSTERLVSPLVVLMVCHVQSLRRNGVKVFIIPSGTGDITPKYFGATEKVLQTARMFFFAVQKP